MKNKPAGRRGRSKRDDRREQRLVTWTVTQTLLAMIKVILWIYIDENHHR